MKITKDDLECLLWDIEMYYASRCYKKEKEAEKAGKEHTCDCPDPMSWSEEKALEWLKNKPNDCKIKGIDCK